MVRPIHLAADFFDPEHPREEHSSVSSVLCTLHTALGDRMTERTDLLVAQLTSPDLIRSLETRVDDWRALHGIPGYPQADGLRPHRLTDAPDTSVRATTRAALGALTGDKEARPVRSTPEHGLGQHPPY
ncbi:hypothetical protein [Streptomyces achromogenes]|uniref:hypothetical protein n=1 Tax=Streptomyces achromogenes TaxID=67255 RepID=UPI00372429EC